MRRRSIMLVAFVEGLAAAAAGVVVGVWLPDAVRSGNTVGLPHGIGLDGQRPALDVLRFSAAAVALAVLAVPLATRVLRWAVGWSVAALGSVVVLVLLLVDGPRTQVSSAVEQVAIGAASGLVLGGTVVALVVGRPVARWCIAAGLAAGFSLGPVVTGYTFRIGDASGAYRWAAGLSAVVCVVAAVLVAGRDIGTHLWRGARGLLAPLLVVAGLAAVALVGDMLRESVLNTFLTPPTPRRVEAVTNLDRYTRLAAAAGIGVLLAWYGFARGGAEVARWVCTGFGLGVILSVNLAFAYVLPNDLTLIHVVVLPAVGLGVVLTRFAGRYFP